MQPLHVVVGILVNDKNEVLIALRPPHVVQPGVWEFPGGKVEKNESLEDALIREFQEEVGITVLDSEFCLEIQQEFPEKNLLLVLHAFEIYEFDGVPHGRENQEIRWAPIDTLNNYVFPQANAEIVKYLMQ